MTATLALRGGERVSARRCIPLEHIDASRVDILCLTLPDLQAQVQGETLGRRVMSRSVFLAYEEVVEDGGPGFVEPGDDDLPICGGEAA